MPTAVAAVEPAVAQSGLPFMRKEELVQPPAQVLSKKEEVLAPNPVEDMIKSQIK